MPPHHLHQADVHVRSAKQVPNILMGGLATVLSGDFLQLPPVDRPSLAAPVEEVRRLQHDDDDNAARNKAPKEDEYAKAEHLGGYDL